MNNRVLIWVQKHSESTWFALAIILLITAATIILPISLGGIRRISDLRSYMAFAQAFQSAFEGGSLFPGWVNDNLGFGSVGLRFYPPIAGFFTALFREATGDWFFAFWISMFTWSALGSLGVYLFVKDWGTSTQAILAAVLFAVVPFHIAEIYRFFLYAEFTAGAFLPFCLLYLTRVCRLRDWKDVIPLAAFASMLVLAHLPSTIIAIITLTVYILLVIDWSGWKRTLLQLLCAASLTVAATSFYWLRVVTELDWVAHSGAHYTVEGSGFGPFLFPNSIFMSAKFAVFSILYRTLDIIIVLTTFLLAPIAAFILMRRKQVFDPAIRVIAAVSATAAFGMFMISRPSGFLWSNLTMLQRLQFPWRWLSIITILTVVSFALSVPLLVKTAVISRRTAVYGVIGLVALYAAYDVRTMHNVRFGVTRTEFNKLAEDFRSEENSKFWWPVWAKKEAFETRDQVTAKDREVHITEWESGRRKFIVDEGDSTTLRVATFYYPYWRATVNRLSVEVGKDENGTITLPIGEARSEVDLRFEEPPLYTAVSWASAAAWLFMLAALCFRYARACYSHRTGR